MHNYETQNNLEFHISIIMSQNFDNTLRDWSYSLTNAEKRELELFHVRGLLALRHVAIEHDFLRAALDYWSPETHCFKFDYDEICPLPEEFGAIFGFPGRNLIAMPTLREYYYQDFERHLNLTDPDLNRIVCGNEVDLEKLANLYFNRPVSESYHVYRRRAYIFCMFSKLLFANGRVGHACLASVLEHVESGRSPMPTCLGETFRGLDEAKADRKAIRKGSLVLLQVKIRSE